MNDPSQDHQHTDPGVRTEPPEQFRDRIINYHMKEGHPPDFIDGVLWVRGLRKMRPGERHEATMAEMEKRRDGHERRT